MEDSKNEAETIPTHVFIVSESATIFAKALLAMFLEDRFEAVKQKCEDSSLNTSRRERWIPRPPEKDICIFF